MAMEGQRDAKNAALIPTVRTLVDSKLGVELFRGSVSLELYRVLPLQVGTPTDNSAHGRNARRHHCPMVPLPMGTAPIGAIAP
ncbi:hypothetical protein C4D60_Mb03t15910 [Musa balbisiana]|uniref:Uncharacterized protein n=1 Tax=Musa balbisiana TaxID=52838 RepID=A0A4S8JC01_MUSBA|nr:hypothetical protein C4D60_Mb03t15910 [Musa balbisiana]